MSKIIIKKNPAPSGKNRMVIKNSSVGGKLKLFPGSNQVVLMTLDLGGGNYRSYISNDSGDSYTELSSEFPKLYQYNNFISFNNRYYYVGDPSTIGGVYYIWQSNNFGQTWTRDASSSGNVRFSVIKGSRDGKYVLGTSGGWQQDGDVLLSKDFGQTWTKIFSSDEWFECFVDPEGKNMIIGGFYTSVGSKYSSDYGTSWNNFPEPLTFFKGAMVSGNGNIKVVWEQYEAATGLGARIYVSNDWNNWTQNNLTVRLSRGAISEDGKYILVASSDGFNGPEPYINLSSDYGVSWSKIDITGGVPKYWGDVAMSFDGKYMIVTPGYKEGYPGYVYKSVDYGKTWEKEESIPSAIFYQARMSKSGRYVYLACRNGGIFHSKDYMNTWGHQYDSSICVGVFINF